MVITIQNINNNIIYVLQKNLFIKLHKYMPN